METSNDLGRIIQINDEFRLRCIILNRRTTTWILESFCHERFLFWKWTEWKALKIITNFGAGDTEHEFTIKREPTDTDQDLIWCAEAELDFLGLEY